MRLVTPALPQALEFGAIEVVLEDWLVLGVRALLDDDSSTLLGTQTSNIS